MARTGRCVDQGVANGRVIYLSRNKAAEFVAGTAQLSYLLRHRPIDTPPRSVIRTTGLL